jgi:hypothetical protein
LRPVRTAVEKPDAVTQSAISARAEIGRAIADKIRELRTGSDLSAVAEEVLPEIEKFLESPEEKRLRHIRFGVALAALGFGLFAAFGGMGLFVFVPEHPGDDNAILFLAALSFGLFLFGGGIAFNGCFLTVPRNKLKDHSAERNAQMAADALPDPVVRQLEAPSYAVTEHTTHSLAQPIPVPRDTNRH